MGVTTCDDTRLRRRCQRRAREREGVRFRPGPLLRGSHEAPGDPGLWMERPGRGEAKVRALAHQPALAVSVSRANSNFEGKDAGRGHEHRARRRESLAPTGTIRPDL